MMNIHSYYHSGKDYTEPKLSEPEVSGLSKNIDDRLWHRNLYPQVSCTLA